MSETTFRFVIVPLMALFGGVITYFAVQWIAEMFDEERPGTKLGDAIAILAALAVMATVGIRMWNDEPQSGKASSDQAAWEDLQRGF